MYKSSQPAHSKRGPKIASASCLPKPPLFYSSFFFSSRLFLCALPTRNLLHILELWTLLAHFVYFILIPDTLVALSIYIS
ncbi:hypothetical protein GQ54DRAFT_197032 [Martensiomyces pterosporus]|nr:hypothetical protein GQ54DRAFT_197032 [Martensiomyces pterosporus]